MPHSAGGIQARSQPEAHVLAVDFLVRQACGLDEGVEAGELRLPYAREPKAGEHAVLAGERDHVGDGAQGGEAGGGEQELAELRTDAVGLTELGGDGPGELEGDAGAAEVAVGVTRRDARMDDRVGIGQVEGLAGGDSPRAARHARIVCAPRSEQTPPSLCSRPRGRLVVARGGR